MTLRLNWLGGLSADGGGPCLLGDTSAFPSWTSQKPLPGSEALTLHLWGQFTGELPAKFRPQGKVGHQYITWETHAAAMAGFEELRAFIKRVWPTSQESLTIKKKSASGTFRLPDHRALSVELIEPNHYELLCGVVESDPVQYSVNEHTKFLAWDQEGGGYVHVGQTRARDELVLMRWWVDEDEHEALVKRRVDTPKKEKKFGTWTFATNAAAVLWSPFAFSELRGVTEAKLKSLAKAQKSFNAKTSGSCGFAMTVKPGIYSVTAGVDEGDGWAARWCRLTLKK